MFPQKLTKLESQSLIQRIGNTKESFTSLQVTKVWLGKSQASNVNWILSSFCLVFKGLHIRDTFLNADGDQNDVQWDMHNHGD